MNSGSNNFQLLPGSPAIGAPILGGCAFPWISMEIPAPSSIDIGAFQSSGSDNDLQIASHEPITVDPASPAGAFVNYVVPAATDPDDPTPPSVTCSRPPGASFQIGKTVVISIATDPDDSNRPQSSKFTVTVLGASAQLAHLARAVKGVGPGASLAAKVAQAKVVSGFR